MSEIGKKVQDAEVVGHEIVDGNKVPILKPEVWEKIYCSNCKSEVDSEEQATGNCNDCGNPWASTSSSITVAANDRYFVDTSGGAKTITLPASPQVGDQVSLLDLAGTFDTNNLTIGRNSLKIMGQSADMTIAVEDAAIQLVYTGSTYGWKLTQNN